MENKLKPTNKDKEYNNNKELNDEILDNKDKYFKLELGEKIYLIEECTIDEIPMETCNKYEECIIDESSIESCNKDKEYKNKDLNHKRPDDKDKYFKLELGERIYLIEECTIDKIPIEAWD